MNYGKSHSRNAATTVSEDSLQVVDYRHGVFRMFKDGESGRKGGHAHVRSGRA